MKWLRFYPWKRTIIKTALLVAVLMLISYFVNLPVLNNQLAMTQLENSNELYIAWEAYNNVRSALPVVYTLLGIVYLVGIGADVHKFIKTKETEGK